MTRYPENSVICLKNRDTIINIDDVPGFELVIPKHCLHEDTKIHLSLHYTDPPFSRGIKGSILLTPIVKLLPHGLEFNNASKPTIILPFLQDALSDLDERNILLEERKLILLYRKDIFSPWQRENCKFATCYHKGFKCLSFPLRHFCMYGGAGDEDTDHDSTSSNQFESDASGDSRTESTQQKESFDSDIDEIERTDQEEFNQIETETSASYYTASDDSCEENNERLNDTIADINKECQTNCAICSDCNTFKNNKTGHDKDIAINNDFRRNSSSNQDEIINIKLSTEGDTERSDSYIASDQSDGKSVLIIFFINNSSLKGKLSPYKV